MASDEVNGIREKEHTGYKLRKGRAHARELIRVDRYKKVKLKR